MPPEIEELMQQSEQLMSYLMQQGSSLNTETQQALGAFLQEVNDFIQDFANKNNILPSIEEVEREQAQIVNSISPPSNGNLPPSETAPLEESPFQSSNVNSFKYDPKSGQLLVKFHGKDSSGSGPIYSYSGIPKHIYDVFRRGGVGPKTSGSNQYHTWVKGVTPSLGASLDALIKKGGYQFTKIS